MTRPLQFVFIDMTFTFLIYDWPKGFWKINSYWKLHNKIATLSFKTNTYEVSGNSIF